MCPLNVPRGLNYTTVAVCTDTCGSDVPVPAVFGRIRMAAATETSAPVANTIAFSWSQYITIKTQRAKTPVAEKANETGFEDCGSLFSLCDPFRF